MVTTDNLPIYKDSYDFLLSLFLVTKELKKEFKYTVGENLKNETIALVLDIYRANSSFEKRITYLQSAREKIETVRLLLRLLRDLRQITLEKFVMLNTKIEIISRQLSGWLKKSQARQ